MPALTLSLWYVHVAKGEERRFGSSNLSLAYSRYRLQTGMLLPRLRRHHRFFNQSAQMRNELLEQACGPRSPPAVTVPAAEAGNHPPDRSQH
jgi:hypothetical protein